MDKSQTFAIVRGRGAALSLVILVTMLAILGLVALVSAQEPPLSVSKTVSPAEVYPDTPIQYTVIFTNETGSEQEIEVISDTLPLNFQFLAVTAESGINDGGPPPGATGTIVWSEFTNNTVPAGGTLSLIYRVEANATEIGPQTNHVQAHLEGGEIIEAEATVTILGVEIDGQKSANVDEIRIGEPVEYTVVLTNSGNTTATLTSIVDTLPPDFGFGSMVSGLPDPGVADNVLTWAGPIEIAAGNTLVFRYEAVAGGTIGQRPENSVVVTYDDDATAGPFSVDVLLLERTFYAYLPLTIRPEEQTAGYRLAYDGYTDGNYEILTINADGSERFNVSSEAGGDLDPDWSPDGQKLTWVHFYDGKGDIMVGNADGTGKVNLTNHAKEDRAPAWSPDGTKIAFHSLREDSRWEIYVMNPDGSDVTRMTFHACQSHDPVWSPDGTKIAYVCGLNEYADVFVMAADGQNFDRLTNNEVPDEALNWSPDGTKIAYVRYDGAAKKDSDIWVVDIASQTNTKLTYTAYADYSPAWSPDGTKIAFSTYLNDSYDIAVMDADGSNIVDLTNAPKGDFVPRWSPDGLKISFVSTREGDRGLYVMNAQRLWP
ncbi:MAG: hypothetical protein P8129_02025 [Anaerolineae bacterium]